MSKNLTKLILMVNLMREKFNPLTISGFTTFQKAVMDYASNSPPNTDHDLFREKILLWEVPWQLIYAQPLSTSSRIIEEYPLFIAGHNSFQKRLVSMTQ